MKAELTRAARVKSLSRRTQGSRKLIDFLKLPASYPHRPRRVLLRQTHISWVFLASPFVFKVKKPINLGFLDFSTLEKRHHFCQRELELNRRLCPDVYLDVLPIYKTAQFFLQDQRKNRRVLPEDERTAKRLVPARIAGRAASGRERDQSHYFPSTTLLWIAN